MASIQLFEILQQLEHAQLVLLLALLAAAAAAAAILTFLALRRRGEKNKKKEALFQWSAVVDWRGLIVEAQGPVDAAVAAYIVQAAKVLEEVGKPVTLRARVGSLELELTPHEEEGLYRVVAR